MKWVHTIYIKQGDWMTYEPGYNTSWAWRKICQVKNTFKEFLFNDQGGTSITSYTLKYGHNWICGDAETKE